MNKVLFIVHFIKTHKKFLIPLLLVLIIIIFIFRPKGPQPIETQTVKRTNITESLSETGTVDADTSVNLSFLTAGKLTYLGAKKGDAVKKGQVLASLDQRTLQKNLETSLRNYSEQRNTFDQTIDNNQGRTVDSALNDAMRRILQNNQYDLDKAVISVELQDLTKEQSVLISPIDGILTREDVTTTGVNVAATNVFSIADPNSLVFKIDVDEADIGKVRTGEKITVTLDPYPDQIITLSVKNIDFTTHTTSTGGSAYTVEASLPASEINHYRIGMNGDAEIVIEEKKNVLTIPLSSIYNDHYVYIKTPEGFVKRDVKVGISNDTDAEILSGLSEGDQVAIDPTLAQKQLAK